MLNFLRLVLLGVLIIFPCEAKIAYSPAAVYLTWQRKPDTTMTVQWITSLNEDRDEIQYRKVGEDSWNIDLAEAMALPQNVAFTLHRIELTHLKQNSLYEFRIGKDGKMFKFHTLPSHLNHSVRFVVGGDMYHGPKFLSHMEKICSESASYDPLFALVGGDIAYSASGSKNKLEDFERWMSWVKAWNKCMVRNDGAIIPIVPAIGNHETNGRFNQSPAQAQFFYAFFPMPGGQGFNVLDFGDYMSLFILDSDHTHRIPGEQTEWLQDALADRKDRPRKFALYHVPAWPSVDTGTDHVSKAIRDNWVPIFEKYNLTTAFENHCHTYKRSHPLLGNAIDESGVLYIGDGAWGVRNTRTPKTPKESWYLARSASIRHFVLVTMEKKRTIYQGIDQWGRVFDEHIKLVGN